MLLFPKTLLGTSGMWSVVVLVMFFSHCKLRIIILLNYLPRLQRSTIYKTKIRYDVKLWLKPSVWICKLPNRAQTQYRPIRIPVITSNSDFKLGLPVMIFNFNFFIFKCWLQISTKLFNITLQCQILTTNLNFKSQLEHSLEIRTYEFNFYFNCVPNIF